MKSLYQLPPQHEDPDDLLKILLDDHSAVFVVDPRTLHLLKFNHKASNLLGSSNGEFVNTAVERLFPATFHAESLLTDLHAEKCARRTTIVDRHGNPVLVDVRQHVVQYDGKSVMVLIARTPEESPEAKTSNDDMTDEDLIETNLHFPSIVGQSDQIRRVCSLIGLVSKTDTTVLIQGESGTGKELIAQAIHFHSLRARGPLVKVNCAALTETLLESELFGHRKGSFTGAIQDRKGRFKLADGGTIILDEIGSMSMSGQAKLLRVLQEKEFEPVGASQTVKVNVRVIAITNSDLITAIHEGRFRDDLYYRLNAFPIYVPPLRERKVDIPLLVRHFLKECKLSLKKEIEELDLRAVEALMDYPWAGNVRELKNTIEYAVIMEKGRTLTVSSLPDKLRPDGSRQFSLKARVESAERQIILEALSGAFGIKSRAAKLLGIDRRNLSYFLHKHRIQ
ncbi:MAG TPA: sigma 54-interacting transcriptional regulator [Pyrinomonadaceae bacterium]